MPIWTEKGLKNASAGFSRQRNVRKCRRWKILNGPQLFKSQTKVLDIFRESITSFVTKMGQQFKTKNNVYLTFLDILFNCKLKCAVCNQNALNIPRLLYTNKEFHLTHIEHSNNKLVRDINTATLKYFLQYFLNYIGYNDGPGSVSKKWNDWFFCNVKTSHNAIFYNFYISLTTKIQFLFISSK